MIYKEYPHNPPHLFLPNAKYFITGSTYQRAHYLRGDTAKELLFESIDKGFNQNGWSLEDWVILNNHYHLMANAPEDALSLSKIIQNIHKFSALKIKKANPKLGAVKRIWYNYRDTCITYERSYFARINYLWHNPVKHGYVDNSAKWRFGSYFYRIKSEREYVERLQGIYPIDRVNVKDDF